MFYFIYLNILHVTTSKNVLRENICKNVLERFCGEDIVSLGARLSCCVCGQCQRHEYIVYAKFRCAPLRIKKALGIFGPLENGFQQQQEQLEWLFGTRLPGPKITHFTVYNTD